MTLKTVKVSRLKEHPRNKDLFSDIRDTNPSFWREFKASIEEFGILEPLVVNRETLVVRSGNQRLLAAVELGLKELPVLLVDEEDTDEEIRRMVATNVYRRQVDPFAFFEYIGKLRIGHSGTGKRKESQAGMGLEDTAKVVHKDQTFVSAADIFNTLPKEQKATLKVWFNEQVEGKKAKSEGELVARLRAIETEALESDERVCALEDEKRSYEAREMILEELLSEKEEQIESLKNLDAEGEIAERDAKIRKLEKAKAALKKKLLKQQAVPPLISEYLEDSIKNMGAIVSSLKEVLEYKDQCDSNRLLEFCELLRVAVQMVLESEVEGEEKWKMLK